MEGCPTLYRREWVKVVLDDDSGAVVLVYVMNTLPRGAKVIPGGDWRNRETAFSYMRNLLVLEASRFLATMEMFENSFLL